MFRSFSKVMSKLHGVYIIMIGSLCNSRIGNKTTNLCFAWEFRSLYVMLPLHGVITHHNSRWRYIYFRAFTNPRSKVCACAFGFPRSCIARNTFLLNPKQRAKIFDVKLHSCFIFLAWPDIWDLQIHLFSSETFPMNPGESIFEHMPGPSSLQSNKVRILHPKITSLGQR